MEIQQVTHDDYLKLIDGKTSIQRSRGGGIVFVEPHQIIKVFSRKKNGLYFFRFLENAEKLEKMQMPIMKVKGAYQVDSTDLFYTIYEPLEGDTLRNYFVKNPDDLSKIHDLALFFARVHDLGIYFRAIHFNNVIVLPEGGFGLIDFGNMIIHRRRLNTWYRARNFRVFTQPNYTVDFAKMNEYGLPLFMEEYVAASNYSFLQKKAFYMWLSMYCRKFNEFL
ncbi:hypothetical protein [Candidatus Uabimicrobium amorphum]|uniref:Toluene tolerance protein n=1 Tax=Uabimicrobium amorphum TaxID=2596890 RepID=A0A5S9IKY2_UABAM|nr:hypothetical protein [Candidatus Uabimicrobium amorphum]BBM82970.1 toluene tolerance protein [Candidatus Uabimicrobium amorphum]